MMCNSFSSLLYKSCSQGRVCDSSLIKEMSAIYRDPPSYDSYCQARDSFHFVRREKNRPINYLQRCYRLSFLTNGVLNVGPFTREETGVREFYRMREF